MINQSLLTLGRVITALVDHTGHIPYRDSKLTRLLQDSLGGSARTVVLATIGPERELAPYTLGTLKFAGRVSLVENVVRVHRVEATEASRLRAATEEIARLRSSNGGWDDRQTHEIVRRVSGIEEELKTREDTWKQQAQETLRDPRCRPVGPYPTPAPTPSPVPVWVDGDPLGDSLAGPR